MPRNPHDIISSIRSILSSKKDPKESVYQIIDAILTHEEREVVERTRKRIADDRSTDDFHNCILKIELIFDQMAYHAPETVWYDICKIGTVILRQEEIESIDLSRIKIDDCSKDHQSR